MSSPEYRTRIKIRPRVAGGVSGASSGGSTLFQAPLAQVEEERKAQRDTHQQRAEKNHPPAAKPETRGLARREAEEHYSGNGHIQREKGADAVGEQVSEEKASVEAVFGKLRKKLRVRCDKSNNA